MGALVANSPAITPLQAQRRGFHSLVLSDWSGMTDPTIIGTVEINGALYEFSSAESIAVLASCAVGTVYVVLIPFNGGTEVGASWTSTPPTWSDSKNGWYNAGGNARYVFQAIKISSTLVGNKQSMPMRLSVEDALKVNGYTVRVRPGDFTDKTYSASIAITGANVCCLGWDRKQVVVWEQGIGLKMLREDDAGQYGQVGYTLAYLPTGIIKMRRLNATDFLFHRQDATSPQLEVMRWDGLYFTQIGTPLALTNTATGICALTENLVAVLRNGTGLQAYTWNGATFAATGTLLAYSVVGDIDALTATDIVVVETTNTVIRRYRFSGGTWALVGTGISLGGTPTGVRCAAIDSLFVAFIEPTTDTLRMYRWYDTTWAQVGVNASLGATTGPCISAAPNYQGVYIADLPGGIAVLRRYQPTCALTVD
jgi:hypothetical protein